MSLRLLRVKNMPFSKHTSLGKLRAIHLALSNALYIRKISYK